MFKPTYCKAIENNITGACIYLQRSKVPDKDTEGKAACLEDIVREVYTLKFPLFTTNINYSTAYFTTHHICI